MGAQAFVLAAGRGSRLTPWTDTTPKPLLKVGRWRLIEWHLLALAAGGVKEVVINTAWLGEQFEPVLGDGARYGLRIVWSHETTRFGQALETAGGIRAALGRLEDAFWVVSADVWIPGYPFSATEVQEFRRSRELARLWLAPNPAHHPHGDFGFGDRGFASRADVSRGTWASVGLFRRVMFEGLVVGTPCPLRPLLESALDQGALGVRALETPWIDVGTRDRWLAAENAARLMAPDVP